MPRPGLSPLAGTSGIHHRQSPCARRQDRARYRNLPRRVDRTPRLLSSRRLDTKRNFGRRRSQGKPIRFGNDLRCRSSRHHPAQERRSFHFRSHKKVPLRSGNTYCDALRHPSLKGRKSRLQRARSHLAHSRRSRFRSCYTSQASHSFLSHRGCFRKGCKRRPSQRSAYKGSGSSSRSQR